VKYVFNNREISHGWESEIYQTNAYYISEIETSYGEKIHFYYTNELVLPDFSTGFVHITSLNLTQFNLGSTYRWVPRLDSIQWPDGKIKFRYDHKRDDLKYEEFYPTRTAYALSDVEIYSNQDLKYQYSMVYEYKSPKPSNCTEPSGTLYPIDYTNEGKRMFLKTVQEYYGDLTIPPYEFIYNNTALPSYHSNAVDYWGYYNGNDNNQCIFPSFYHYYHNDTYTGNEHYPGISKYTGNHFSIYRLNIPSHTNEMHIQRSDRSPSAADMVAGILEKVYYPTGGYTRFEYEMHDFLNPTVDGAKVFREGNSIPTSLKGGGLRLAKKFVSDGSGGEIEHSYHYIDSTGVSSGKLLSLPLFAKKINFFEHGINQNITLYSNPINIFHDDISSPVMYSEIREEIKGVNGLKNGHGVRKYNIPGSLFCMEDTYVNNEPLFRRNFNTVFIIPIVFPGMKDYYAMCNAPIPYNIPTTIHSWNRGQLIEEQIFNKEGGKVRQMRNNYKIIGMEKVRLFFYEYNHIIYGECFDFHSSVFTPYYQISAFIHLESTQIDEYLPSGGTISQEDKYEYCPARLVQTKHSRTTSQGEYTHIETTYPHSYPGHVSTCPTPGESMAQAIDRMVKRNMLNYPVETITYLGDKIVAGSLNLYRNHGNGVVLDRQMLLDLTQPLNGSSFTKSRVNRVQMGTMQCNTNFIYDSRYRTTTFYDSYDSKANLLQYRMTNNVNASYLWGYNQTLPIAQVQNASHSRIAYTSFEEPTNHVMGGWDYDFSDDNHTKVDSYSGKRSYKGSSISKTGLPSGTYIVSYWARKSGSGNGSVAVNGSAQSFTTNQWVYWEVELTNITSVNISLSGVFLDELRLYPKGALMTTYTHDPLIGITSETDTRGITTRYEYDGLGRLVRIRDHEGKIINQFEYEYAQ
jgi:YD repeat-containing protein